MIWPTIPADPRLQRLEEHHAVEADVDEEAYWGVGIHPSIVTASLRAVINAVNRAHALRSAREEAAAAFD